MNKNKMRMRLAGAASAMVLGGFLSVPASAQDSSRQLDEIIVTATKKAENLQDISIAVQTLGEQEIEQLNINNFDDYVRYLPGVNSAGRGPGQSSVFIRGIATDSSDQTSIEIGAPQPNVALYLDEQPVSTTGRNLDVYAADIARVEVLPGPQGTLYGASSQAGTIRLITNKPQYDEFSGNVQASLATTKSGDISHSQELVLNVPIIEDKLAVRGVLYRSQEGGYIDNVLGTYNFDETTASFPAGGVPSSITNEAFVEENFNDTVYTGGRLSVGFKPNDDWEILAQYLNQSLDVDGVFDHSPDFLADLQPSDSPNIGRVVGDLQVQRFADDFLEDEFQQYALTVKGRVGALDLVYAGSFLEREVNNSFDYTTYNNIGAYAYYYVCLPDYVTCGDPTTSVNAFVKNKRQTHEFRASYEGERLSVSGGVFLDDIETGVNTEFFYPNAIGNLPQNSPFSDATQFISGARDPGVTFFNDAIRGEEQLAFFGQVKYDVLPDFLSVSLGARHYDIESTLVGSSNFATFGAEDADSGVNYDTLFAADSPLKEDGVVIKGTVEVTPSDDTLFYATYSEGFRPGGFNRIDNEDVPRTYLTDSVDNYELGWKTTLLDGALRFNGALYYIEVGGLQVGITDFDVSVLTFTANAADAEIKGLEANVTYAASDNLTLSGALSINDTEIVGLPPAVSDVASIGSDLALAPKLQFNTRARYEWNESSNYPLYAQAVFSYTDKQFSSIVQANRFQQDSYISLDGSIGGQIGDNVGWEVFIENLTDERAQLFINSLDTDLRVTTNRPRTVGIRGSYDF